MLHKWKFILTNWINCYFNESSNKEQCVNLDSLLTIISHLRENLTLDESKSSKLEAHTVEEFIQEKYPQFKFENGTVEATNEEDIYIVASLLLFFVCVNSKDVDIKHAMCSKLSSEDQETIMKFSKSLMECSPITFRDVQAAITGITGGAAGVEAAQTLSSVTLWRGKSLRVLVDLCMPYHCVAVRIRQHTRMQGMQAGMYILAFMSKTGTIFVILVPTRLFNPTEACGQEIIAAGESVVPKMVAETPPALRSLHGEVRRLQAALDAERFDRNYLQDELARTNMRLEKLLKDKEQYKLDILNLKAKISLCCGQETEAREGDTATESTSRLTRQLEDLEERLVATQEQLDDALMERDTYKSKVEQLKQERDKWLLVSQTEASRAAQLSEELETERHHVQSLRDLVTELRLHNMKNCLDASQLECDDLDASIHSLHNASVCSEACVNVIEVQLGEERAKIIVLKQQIQEQQDQLNDLNQRAENETQSLRSIIAEKDNDILNFKHRLNEEIEEKNKLKTHFSDVISKLNNEINELEQKLKYNSDSCREVIKQNMQEIKTLQESKLSLLQSLTDETTKHETIIKDLRTDIDTEKNLKLKMKEDYENHILELNEKVLKGNNELLELQKKICEKSAVVEQLRLDLTKEKESKEELSNKCNDDITQLNERSNALERNLQRKTDEAKELQVACSEACANVIAVEVQLGEEKAKLAVFKQQIQELQDQLNDLNQRAENETQSLRSIIADKDNDILNLKHKINEEIEEKNKLNTHFSDEICKLNNENNELEQKLKNNSDSFGKVIEQKMQEIKTLQEEKLSLLQSLTDETTKLESIIKDLRTDIYTEKNLKLKMNEDYENHVTELNEKVSNSNNELLELQNKICEKSVVIEQLRIDLRKEKESSEELSSKCNDDITKLHERNNALERNLQQKCEETRALQVAYSEACSNVIAVQAQLGEERAKLVVLEQQIQELQDQLSDLDQKTKNEKQTLRSIIVDKENDILNFKDKINEEIEEKNQLKTHFSDEISKLNNEINELEQKLKDNSEICGELIKQKIQEIKTLQEEKLSLLQSLTDETTKLETIIKDLRTDIDTERKLKLKMTEDYENHTTKLNEKVLNRNNELVELQNKICEESELIEQLRLELRMEKESKEDLSNKYNDNITQLNERNNALERNLQQKCEEAKELQVACSEACANVVAVQAQLGEERAQLVVLKQQIQELQDQLSDLNQRAENESQSLRSIIVEKDKLSDKTTKLESIIKNLRADNDTEENLKLKMKEEYENHVTGLNEKVSNSNNELLELQNKICEKSAVIEQLRIDLRKEKESKEELSNKCNDDITQLNERNNALERNLQQKCEEAVQLQVVCSEACANVIEVQAQLEEERTKLIVLEQQILELQLNDLNRRAENESQSFRSVIAEKDNDILNIKNQINEEIENKNQLKANFSDELNKLSNELEQKLKDNSESCGKVIKQNIQEIKTLQDEKLSLLQSLTDETIKLEYIIKDLRADIITEENLKLKMKEDHENQVIELNEKLLNCNNELLKLQNKICEKSAVIEQLRLDLRKEKESKEELSNKFNDDATQLNNALERNLQQKCEEARELQDVYSEACANVVEVQVQLEEERAKTIELKQQMKELQDQLSIINQRAENESQSIQRVIAEKDNIKHRVNEEIEEKNQLKTRFSDEISKLNNEINELEQKLKHTSDSSEKVIEQNMQEIKTLQEEKMSLLQSVTHETTKLVSIIKDLRTDIDTEKNLKLKMKEDYENDVLELNEKVSNSRNELLELQNKICEKSAVVEQLRLDLKKEKESKEELSIKCNDDITQLNERNDALERNLQKKCEEAKELQVVCSEACGNVIEVQVQLGEERAKLVALEQQIQGLQDKLSDSIQKADSDTQSLRNIIADKNNDILNLKHQINEEIEEKNQLKAYVGDEISKLNNELEQKLKDNSESCGEVIKQKMQEIKTLQEGKLSLLQSLTDETTKLESIIKDLRTDIDTEKHLKLKMKEDYENHITTLNEKVLNRNNELVELQNKICEESELIEQLRLELRNEKESKEELSNICNDNITQLNERNNALERNLQQKYEEAKVQAVCREACANVIGVQLGEERAKIIVLKQQIQGLQDQLIDRNERSENEKESLRITITEKEKEIFNLKHIINEEIEEKNQLKAYFNDEMSKLNNNINELEQQLQDSSESCGKVIEQKMQELKKLQEEKLSVSQSLSEETAKFETIIKDLRTDIDTEKNLKLKMKEDYENHKMKLNEKVLNRNNELLELQNKICEKSAVIEQLRLDLKKEKEYNEELSNKCNDNITQLNERNNALERNLQQKCEEAKELQVSSEACANVIEVQLEEGRANIIVLEQQIQELQDKLSDQNQRAESEMQSLRSVIAEKDNDIFNLKELIDKEIEDKNQLKTYFSDEMGKLNNELKQKLKHSENCGELIKQKMQEIETLQEEKLSLLQSVTDETTKFESIIKDLRAEIETEKHLKLKMKEEYENQVTGLNEKVSNSNNELLELQHKICEKSAVIEQLRIDLRKEKESKEELSNKCNDDITQLNERNNALERNLQQRCEEAKELQAAMANQEMSSSNKYSGQIERHQVSITSDLTHSSMESIKTINDLEKIIHDKNRTITTLQSDVTYLKSIIAESENKLLDVNKELEVSQETCQQLSSQLKKIVHQKNEEIAELKKQVAKMSVTENSASQIIKVSAKYQAIILKKIAEIKSNTVLKELTNFGNNANSENELKRNLNCAITIEDLENFLETTDRHLKRCTEKQLALQKDRDRLTEVNRINESEIINMKKFLTELSVSFKTFNSVKELYAQKLSRVVSVQRTVRREILDLDGRITDAMMCKLERGYAAILQDLSECAMNLERWVERCIGRTISAEKIKQAFSSESDRNSLTSFSYQNASLEVQLDELENSFQKLLQEILRAQKGEGAKSAQAVTVMEVRAEYEDKLNRMKAKMKQLYQEQIAIFKDKQKDEVAALERELRKTREKLAECSRGYEEHIRSLTNELWSVGEKFLMKKDEAEWLRRKQRSGSLMSLQHVHSSGLVPPPEEPSRPSDTHSLRSLPVHTNTIREKREGREGRGLHMSDEEGEVFDNRWLKELSATPRRQSVPPPPGQRLSELQWRNSLCPPHLKSSYPAETQFVATLQEEDIKCVATTNEGKQQRKEVGITAYKKPGPPTPSKQAGRLSATGSELREWQRVEAETQSQASRRTGTPSRLFNMFRSNKNDTNEGTPRRRLSNIFRKK